MTDRLHKPWFSFGIGVIHQVAGLLLVIFATWFLAASATATVGFNYMLPAVAIRVRNPVRARHLINCWSMG